MKSFKAVVCCILLLSTVLLMLSACQPKNAQKAAPAAEKTAVAPAEKAPPKAEKATNTPAAQPTAVPPTAAPAKVEPAGTVSAALLLDPALAEDADSLKISAYVYSGLVRLDASGKPEPALAESWVISEDGLDYIFKLRANATFSDGVAITPDIVKANFDRWFDPASELRGDGKYAAWQRTFLGFLGEKDDQKHAKSSVDGIEKVDQYTVLIHLNRQVPEFLTYLADPAFAILNPDAIKAGSYGARGSVIDASGPYMVSEWTEKQITLVANPKYWDKAPGKALNFNLK